MAGQRIRSVVLPDAAPLDTGARETVVMELTEELLRKIRGMYNVWGMEDEELARRR